MSRAATSLPYPRSSRDGTRSLYGSATGEVAPLVVLIGNTADERELLRAAARMGAVTLVAHDAQTAILWLREATQPTGEAEPADPVIAFGSLVVDVLAQQAWWQGSPLPLTAQEFRLLAALAEHPGTTLSFTDLSETVWGSKHHGDRWMVRSGVQRLRRKLDSAKITIKITSIRGIGFRLDDSPSGGQLPGPRVLKRYHRRSSRIPGRQMVRHSLHRVPGDPN
jgi:DNA-binding response OmpR family regulator